MTWASISAQWTNAGTYSSALVELINLSQKIRTREKIDLVKSFERFSESNERLYRKLAEVVDEIEKWLITMEDKPVTKQT